MTGDRVFDCLLAMSEYVREGRPGYVYFIQGVDGGPIKIGYTAKRDEPIPAWNRRAQLQYSSPVELTILNTWPASTELERHFHKVFKADRLYGEWFAPSDDLHEVIWYMDDPWDVDLWQEAFYAECDAADAAWLASRKTAA
jgi:hypothetical protein